MIVRFLHKAFLRIWFAPSNLPELWGLQEECKKYLIKRALATYWVMWEAKEGPLPLFKDRGRPNLGMISFNNCLATSWALSVQVGNASIHR